MFIAAAAAVVVLSSVENRGVTAQTVKEAPAVFSEGELTGIGESVFAMIRSTAPELKLKTKEIELDNGASFDALEFISDIVDESWVMPLLKITGFVDTEENDTYQIRYELMNQNGETAEEVLNVTVRYSEEQLREIEEQRAAEEAERLAEEAREQAAGGNVSLSTLGVYDTGTVYSMVEAINAVRAAYGLYPYAYASEAGFNAAAIRAQECTYYLSHTRPNGTDYDTALDECGVSYNYAYEILVAYGSSVEENLNWWLSEPGHRNIVLGSAGTYIAVGYADGIWSAEVY